LEHPPCHAQVDFGNFAYYDCDGTQRGGHTLIVSFPYSNAGWMQVFPAENQECLDWRDYLPALTKKPNAATETKFFGQNLSAYDRLGKGAAA